MAKSLNDKQKHRQYEYEGQKEGRRVCVLSLLTWLFRVLYLWIIPLFIKTKLIEKTQIMNNLTWIFLV